MIQLVVFDLAGTTVYDGDGGDGVADAFCAALAKVGVTPSHGSISEVRGLPKPLAIQRMLVEAGRAPNAAEIDAVHQDFVQRMRKHYATSPLVREIPGAAETFKTLRQAGIKVALNTGFSRGIVEVLLRRLGWGIPAVIDAVVTSDEVPRGRPHPDMIHRLMSQLNIDDARCVAKVGDTASDLLEGQSAGCGLVIGVTSGAFTHDQLQQYPHTHILRSVADVSAVVLSP